MISACVTSNGDKCVFPFIYKGKKYEKCTLDDGGDREWCSTQTDSSGNHISGKFGRCIMEVCTSKKHCKMNTSDDVVQIRKSRKLIMHVCPRPLKAKRGKVGVQLVPGLMGCLNYGTTAKTRSVELQQHQQLGGRMLLLVVLPALPLVSSLAPSTALPMVQTLGRLY